MAKWRTLRLLRRFGTTEGERRWICILRPHRIAFAKLWKRAVLTTCAHQPCETTLSGSEK
eukprot:6090929-Pleurochrysis_carterae.AAC.1